MTSTNLDELKEAAYKATEAHARKILPTIHHEEITEGMARIRAGSAVLVDADTMEMQDDDGTTRTVNGRGCTCALAQAQHGTCLHTITRRLLRYAYQELRKQPPKPQPQAPPSGVLLTMAQARDLLDERYHHYLVAIQGRPYLTVAGRMAMASDEHRQQGAAFTVDTSYLQVGEGWLCRAYVTSAIHGSATGHAIVPEGARGGADRSNPYEVAETSAIGRALGFLGYGLFNGVASAEEIQQAG